jgi:(p)ppGpp synthase/HD superfamily hydrolase
MGTVYVKPRHHVLAFVALKHFGQLRKYTNEPYLNHLQAVAKMADGKCQFGYEIGLCHDLLEDTDCEDKDLYEALERFGYNEGEREFIINAVIDLTDVYTHELFPELNRKARKEREAYRLHLINHGAQTVKYCDIINNSESILQYDLGFAKKYIPEMKSVLLGMNKGDEQLYKKAFDSVNISLTAPV